ncbi:MAG: B12-binding domain-containing radical SAM protein, partial [Actinomycetota bacterium]
MLDDSTASRHVFQEDWPPDELEDLLARVVRPGRYVGGEFNLRRKPGVRPRIVLSYPDAYEVGISNPGLQILYELVNDRTPAAAERAYCPLPDMADLMRPRGV